MRFWRESLLARLLSYFLLLAIIPLAIVGALAYNRGEEALREDILSHLTTTAILKEDEINRWVESLEQDTRLLAQNPILREHATTMLTHDETSREFAAAYQVLKSYMDSVLAEKPDLLEILILRGVGGEVLFSTNGEHEGDYEVTSTFFIEGRKGTYVQNIYPSVSLGKPAMTIATPLQDEGGQTLGVLAVHLNLVKLDDIMLERGGLGATGETYLVDRLNVFVSEARFGGESFPRGVHTQGIDAALREEDGAGIYTNYRDVPVIGAYRWLDDREMALLAEIELDEAMAPVRGLALAIFLVGFIAAGLVAVTAYVVTRRISGPILVLAESATQFAGGDLSQTVDIQRDDEIGTLVRTFNSMATQLRGLITGLEQRVAERTRGLQTAAEVSRVTTSVLDPDELLHQTVDLVRERFNLYYVGLFLLDAERRFAVLRAGTGVAGQQMLAQGHRLPVGGDSMIGQCVAQAEACIALDVGEEAVRFDNPLLPDTRSELALPLRSRGRIIGAMTVQSMEEAAFDEASIAVMQTMADQVAVAIDNARLFAETQAALKEMEATHQRYLGQAWAEYGRIRTISGYEQTHAEVKSLHEEMLPGVVQAVAEKRAIVLGDDEGTAGTAVGSALVVPVVLRGQTIGALGFRETEKERTWSAEDIALAQAISDQFALAADNLRLLGETQRRAAHDRMVSEATARMRETLDVETVLQTAIREMGKTLGIAKVEVRMSSGDGPGTNADR